MTMRIKPLLDAKAELTHNDRNNCPVVLSTRIRLARNLADHPFPGWAEEKERQAVLEACFEAGESLAQLSDGSQFLVGELSNLERQILMERHLISRELMNTKNNGGVLISSDQAFSVMVNEEDHLRIQLVRNGFHFKRLWKAINELDSGLEQKLDYAFSADLGYLTACPTNLGTAMRASAMMHLPALVIAGQMEKVIRAVNQLGMAVRGLFGEGSDASGSIFQISNQQTLGESEEDIIKRLTSVLESVVEQEIHARGKLLEDDGTKLFDKIGRARGILQNGHVLSSAEAMNLLSLMRLAVDLKLLPESCRQEIDRFLIECQPGHVQFAAQDRIESDQRDLFRAKMLRDAFTHLPTLDLDNLSQSEPQSS